MDGGKSVLMIKGVDNLAVASPFLLYLFIPGNCAIIGVMRSYPYGTIIIELRRLLADATHKHTQRGAAQQIGISASRIYQLLKENQDLRQYFEHKIGRPHPVTFTRNETIYTPPNRVVCPKCNNRNTYADEDDYYMEEKCMHCGAIIRATLKQYPGANHAKH